MGINLEFNIKMIKQISLRNFKKFASVDIDLNANDLSIFAGGNSSGKTSILHAFAVWEYAKILLINNRGRNSLNATQANRGKGLGILPADFSPIDIPSLRCLWYKQNTQGSYGMSIKVVWDSNVKNDAYLKLSFTLNGNNFAIKNTESNLTENEIIPTVAYLPPFAGISSHENKVSLADMRTLIGKGLAGAVIRNLLILIYLEHQNAYLKKKEELLRGRKRLPKNQRNELDNIPTSWNILNNILIDIFRVKLLPHEFDERFHNYINIDIVKIDIEANGTIKEDKESIQDLMMEGSGFLQWLSVFTYAIDRNNNVLLLDEPDAHLHRALQTQMMNALKKIVDENSKQILIVSHNSELIEYTDFDKVLFVRNSQAKYLNSDLEKVPLLEGLGSDYFPLLSKIKQYRKIIFIENDSDWRVLKALCEQSGKRWPENLVKWITNKKHSERKHIMIELAQKCINEANQPLTAYSLRDLDDDNYSTVNNYLIPNGNGEQRDDSGNHVILRYRTFRRREIENYLIIPDALSRYLTSKKNDQNIDTSIDAINSYLSTEHGLIIPTSYKQSDRGINSQSIFSNDVKPVFNGINRHFRVSFSKDEYVGQILREEICDDINLIIDEVIQMCN